MTWLIETLGFPGIATIAVICCCLAYLISGSTDKDGYFESGVSKLGYGILSLIIFILLIRFGML